MGRFGSPVTGRTRRQRVRLAMQRTRLPSIHGSRRSVPAHRRRNRQRQVRHRQPGPRADAGGLRFAVFWGLGCVRALQPPGPDGAFAVLCRIGGGGAGRIVDAGAKPGRLPGGIRNRRSRLRWFRLPPARALSTGWRKLRRSCALGLRGQYPGSGFEPTGFRFSLSGAVPIQVKRSQHRLPAFLETAGLARRGRRSARPSHPGPGALGLPAWRVNRLSRASARSHLVFDADGNAHGLEKCRRRAKEVG